MDQQDRSDLLALRALIGLVALYEIRIPAEKRCRCPDPPVNGMCAYCIATAEIRRGRLAMDERLVGRG